VLIVWLWTIFSFAGLAFSYWNARDSQRDLSALRTMKRNGPAILAARFLRNTERIRGLMFISLALVGVAALLTPYMNLSEAWAKFVGEAIGWVLLLHVWLLMLNTAQSTVYRRRIREKEAT
jgi:hypothetical protein